jgi:hypothetical protein
MQLSAGTKLNDLLSTHPYLEDFLVAYNPHFKLLKNKITRATVGRVATIGAASRIAGVDVNALLDALATAIEKETRTRPEVEGGAVVLTREQRIGMLGHIIEGLHNGGDLATARTQFAAAVGDVDAGEIATMEEEMIRGGLPVAEVRHLVRRRERRGPLLFGGQGAPLPAHPGRHRPHGAELPPAQERRHRQPHPRLVPRRHQGRGRVLDHHGRRARSNSRPVGTKSEAEFWITMGGKFIHIRYFAVRDGAGQYRGCLEVTQDITNIRKLDGERRLLDWK